MPDQLYSLAHLTVLPLAPPEMIDVAHRCGYGAVGVRIVKVTPGERHYDLANDKPMLRETKARLKATGVVVLDVELLRLDATTEPETFEATLATAAELGAKHIIVHITDPDRVRAADRLGRLAALARPYGLFVDLEFPFFLEVGSLAGAADLVRGVDTDNLGILVDVMHMARSHSSLDLLQSLPASWFRFAHLCDAPAEVPTTLEARLRGSREERLFPGEGGIDIRAILGRLPAGIPYGLEMPRAAMMRAVGPEMVADLALRVTRSYLEGRDYVAPEVRRSA